MSLDSGVSLGTLIVSMSVLLVSGGIAWGLLQQRVSTLEKEVAALSGFSSRLTRVETKVESIQDDVTEIKNDTKAALTELRSFAAAERAERRRP